jgi:hypothetical protein
MVLSNFTNFQAVLESLRDSRAMLTIAMELV